MTPSNVHQPTAARDRQTVYTYNVQVYNSYNVYGVLHRNDSKKLAFADLIFTKKKRVNTGTPIVNFTFTFLIFANGGRNCEI